MAAQPLSPGGGGSDPEYGSDDSSTDPTLEETNANLSNLSINSKSKTQIDEDHLDVVVPDLNQIDAKSYELVHKIIQDKQIEKLKVEQCKLYLRKNGLRLTGVKATLIQRIKEHLEILNGGGEKKYPPFSFVLNCKGDARTGDVVMFEQMFMKCEAFSVGVSIFYQWKICLSENFQVIQNRKSRRGPLCGTRIVAGRIVKESYGAAKQQHTFTIEVLWSKGEKPLPPLHPLLIKGRNLYRLKTLRQRWEDEGERRKALMDKHSRGSLARSDREARVHEKEMRKTLRTNRVSRTEKRVQNQSQLNSISTSVSSVQPHQSYPLVNPANLHQSATLRSTDTAKPATSGHHFNKPATQPQPQANQQSLMQDPRFSQASQRQPFTRINHALPAGTQAQKPVCRHYA